MGLSFWQILIVVAVILIIFGPSRIPSLGRSLGQAIRGFKRGLDEDIVDGEDSEKKISSPNTHLSEKSSSSNAEKLRK